ncbi:hypothetical protein N0V90_003880 [Kalmusia sp. IMI 367209]|nr:hypothetical protein N0V90_003880 [Kalmusia sp. IMI 367209]
MPKPSLRKSHASSSSDEPHRTPSPRSSHSSDGLPAIEGHDAYELQPVSPVEDRAPRHEDEDEEEGLIGRRDSVASVQSYELYTPDEEGSVVRSLTTDIGNARIAGMADDLKLSSKQYEWLLWAFYITYIAFEWMTLLYRVIPPHIYISLCILSWGIIAAAQATVTSFSFLLVLRALLGISEAAFGPGVPFYLSFFFRRNELAFRTGLFISASPLSASFAGALAWLITWVGEKGPLSPWRLLFLIEGFPSVVVAVWAWGFVPDGPGVVKWLSGRERKVAVLRLRQEKEDEEEDVGEKLAYGEEHKRGVNLREVLQTLKDPNCYLTALMFFASNVAFASMPVFLPTILHDMGHTALTSQALSAPPYLTAFLAVLLTAYLSDKWQSRSFFIILHSLLATAGYATIALCGYLRYPGTTVRYLALYPATAGFFSASKSAAFDTVVKIDALLSS